MAEEKKQEMLDPIAYREDFPKEYLTDYDPMADLTPEYLENMDYGKEIGGANQSFSQYWDDSSPDYQNKSKWWLNDKYTWEWVKNDQVNYDANLMLKDLNPNFVYWLASKVYGTDHPWYITQRNDQIASALYNEWKTSKDDVAYFLWQQKWWMNSSEADRANTIEAVYKRLWAIAEQNPKEEEKPDLSKADNLVQDTSGKIYWKTTAEEWEPSKWIDTLADANSVFTSMQESRAAKLKSFISMNPADIAELMNSWTAAFDEQTVRDAQQYYPEFMAQVNAEKKKKIWQQNVNAIMNWWEMVTDTNWQSNANNSIAEFWASNATWTKSSTEITKDVHNAMAQSQTASEASETMAEIEESMAILKNRMKNLRKEANAAFKWDVPDYLVNAYINNKAQEIQNQMSILEDRYNAAYNRYKTELSNKQWEMEYKLKQEQLQIQKDELALKDYQIKNWITATKDTSTSTTNPWDKFQVTTLSDKEVAYAVDQLYSMFDNWQLGNAQCGVWIQRYYLPMLWISISGISSLEWKKSLINEDEWYTPKKWDLIIINSGAKLEDWTPAWHIGIVLEVHSDWTVEYMDWNGKSNEKPAINGININSKSILWYRNINKWQWQNSWWWTEQDYANFEKLLSADTDKSDVEAIALKYWYKDNVPALTQIARDAIAERWPVETPTINENSTWVDYVGLTKQQLEDVEKQIWYNPNAEWYFKSIIEEGKIPTTWPAMQNAIKITWAKDERQFWQWLEHYQNKVNAEAVKAWEDILLLLAQLQNAYDSAWRKDEVIKDWKKKTVFDTNTTQWRWWGEIGIKYEQLINQLLLNKVTEARKKWATFWQMTEYEWDILKNASSALKIKFWYWSSDESFSNAFFDLVNATWKLTRWEWEWPTDAEWNNFVDKVKNESKRYMTWDWISEEDAIAWLNSWKSWASSWWNINYVDEYSILQ